MVSWLGRWLLRAAGLKIAGKVLHGSGKRAPMLDVGLGFALLRDRRVPVGSKGLALLLGAAAVAALIAIELPVEALIALLLNAPGLGFDLLIDGIEAIAGPVLFGSLFLLRLAPPHIVAALRAERQGVPAPAPNRRWKPQSALRR